MQKCNLDAHKRVNVQYENILNEKPYIRGSLRVLKIIINQELEIKKILIVFQAFVSSKITAIKNNYSPNH